MDEGVKKSTSRILPRVALSTKKPKPTILRFWEDEETVGIYVVAVEKKTES